MSKNRASRRNRFQPSLITLDERIMPSTLGVTDLSVPAYLRPLSTAPTVAYLQGTPLNTYTSLSSTTVISE